MTKHCRFICDLRKYVDAMVFVGDSTDPRSKKGKVPHQGNASLNLPARGGQSLLPSILFFDQFIGETIERSSDRIKRVHYLVR